MLAVSFFMTALLYASVGFGGGSTYNALLVLAEVDFRILPVIALLCNLIVVSGGTDRFFREGHIRFGRVTPWIVTSVPAAFLGGMLDISETFFIGLLGFSLLAAGVRMLCSRDKECAEPVFYRGRFLAPVIGTVLGLLAGLVGIGGGIFLAPVLYLLRWGTAREIAGTCSLFILVNSLAGLIGQMTKSGDSESLISMLSAYWMLFPAVLIGGQIGSYMGAVRLNPKIVHLMTAMLILYVSARLIWRWWGMVVQGF